MNAEGHYNGACEITEHEARAELERLLSDPKFHGTERAKSILRYLAERSFGQSQGVKAYSIALDVLGRTSDFDPSADPIVRIEVSRLRSFLSQYYEAFGHECGLSIHLPKGRYVVAFTRCVLIDRPTEEQVEDLDAAEEEGSFEIATVQSAPSAGQRSTAMGWKSPAALAVIVAAASASAALYLTPPAYTDKPVVAVVMSAADESLKGEAGMTRDMLMAALTHFQTLKVASDSLQNRPLSKVLRPASANSYQIEMKYYGEGEDRSVWWQIVETGDGDLLKSGLDQVNADGKSPAAVREELVAMLARRIATSRGVINNIETHENAADTLGNACVLRAEYQLETGGAADIATASRCLEKTVSADPGNSDAAAALSRVLAAESSEASNSIAMARALELANRAVSLSPLSDRAEIALMVAQFHIGRIDAAINAGNRAMALNRNNPDVSAKLGMVLFSAGYWEAGVSMAEDAARHVDAVPRDAALVLALDAYRRGDWSKASLIAEQVNCGDFMVRVLRVAALGQLGSDQAAQRLADVKIRDPEFEKTFHDRISWRHYRPVLSASLQDGLRKAGAQFTPESLASAF